MAGLELMEGSMGSSPERGKRGKEKRERGARLCGCGLGSARGLLGEFGAGCPVLRLLALCYVLNVRKETGRRKEKGEEKEKEGKEKKRKD
jgi:hypothetical protein